MLNLLKGGIRFAFGDVICPRQNTSMRVDRRATCLLSVLAETGSLQPATRSSSHFTLNRAGLDRLTFSQRLIKLVEDGSG